MLLSNAKLNVKYKIDSITGNSNIKRKLLEMGFVNNTEIEIIHVALFNDPIIVKIRGYSISLRLKEASLINLMNLC